MSDFADLAVQIATALKGKYHPMQSDERSPRLLDRGYLEIDGFFYFIREAPKNADRIEVQAPSRPVTLLDGITRAGLVFPHRPAFTPITLSRAKTLAQIAADIQRRVITPWNEAWPKMQAGVAADEERRALRRQRLESLGITNPDLKRQDYPLVNRLSEGQGNMDLDYLSDESGECTVTLKWVPIDKVRRILQIMRE